MPDPFRTQYRQLSEEEKKKIAAIKEKAAALYADLSGLVDTGAREMALARTKLEEAVMWATKAITG